MELLQRNLGLKILALVLAVVGWAYVRFAANPALVGGQYNQQLAVPITAANLALGYVAHFTDREAVVTVASRRNEQAIKPEEIKAVLDLSNKGAGIYNVPVQLVAPDIAVQSLSPASVTLTIERVEERQFPIVAHFSNPPPNGIVVTTASIHPSTATVRAPTSALAQVVAVQANIALPSEPKEIDEMVRPVPVDASGAEVAGAGVSPELVRVQLRATSAAR